MLRIITVILLSLFSYALWSQEKELIYVEHADQTRLKKTAQEELRILNGDVQLYQDSTFMFCDSASIRGNFLVAVGNVVLVQSDTISVFGDSLVYNGNTQKARLFYNVTLENGEEKLYTERLDYDVGKRIATYRDTALLVNQSTQLQSIRGIYDVNEKLATFKDYVVVRDSAFDLRADSLKYNTGLGKAIFISATRIKTDSAQIYCQGGFYDFRQKESLLTGDPQYESNKTRAAADSIYYNQRTGDLELMGNAYYEEESQLAKAKTIRYNEKSGNSELIGEGYFKQEESTVEGEYIKYNKTTERFYANGRAQIIDGENQVIADTIDYLKNGIGDLRGDVIWTDTSSNSSLYCDMALYDEQTDYIKAMGRDTRPYMESISEGDTMYLAADTLFSFSMEEIDTLGVRDTMRVLKAYNDVRIYKSNLQAIGDSLYFNDRDSIFSLFDNPFVWSDSTQFSADTIDLYMKNESLNRAHLKSDGLILNFIESEYFNQIKGRDINVYFSADTLDYMTVEGNAESIYYMLDDEDAFIGANTTICSKIWFKFANKSVVDIKFYDTPTSVMIPILEVDPIALRLKNFVWNQDAKPVSLLDIIHKEGFKTPSVKNEEPKKPQKDALPQTMSNQ